MNRQKKSVIVGRAVALSYWVFVALFIAVLRIPSLTNAFFDPDVAATVYSAQLFANGSCIYPDAVETKPPGSYAMAALFLAAGRGMVGFHALLILYHLIVALILADAVRRQIGVVAGRAAGLLYGVYSAGGFVNGLAPNFETWTLLPIAATAWAISRQTTSRSIAFPLAAGVAAGAATLMKQQAVVIAAGFGLVAAAMPFLIEANRPHRSALRAAVAYGAGLLVPWAVIFGYFGALGCAGDLVAAMGTGRAGGYLTANRPGETIYRATQSLRLFGLHYWFLVGAGAGGLALHFTSTRHRTLAVLNGAWLAVALVAVGGGTMFFPHYFFFLVPPLCVSAAWLFATLVGRFAGRVPAVVFWVALATVLARDMRQELAFSRIAAANLLATGNVSSRSLFQYNLSLGSDWNEACSEFGQLEFELHAQAVGRYIRRHSDPSDMILVYDYHPSIYWYAGRFAPTRHHMNFEVAFELPGDYGRWYDGESARLRRNRAELMGDLERHAPRFIVRIRFDRPTYISSEYNPLNIYGDRMTFHVWRTPLFDELDAFVKRNYREVDDGPKTPFVILEHVGPTVPNPRGRTSGYLDHGDPLAARRSQ